MSSGDHFGSYGDPPAPSEINRYIEEKAKAIAQVARIPVKLANERLVKTNNDLREALYAYINDHDKQAKLYSKDACKCALCFVYRELL